MGKNEVSKKLTFRLCESCACFLQSRDHVVPVTNFSRAQPINDVNVSFHEPLRFLDAEAFGSRCDKVTAPPVLGAGSAMLKVPQAEGFLGQSANGLVTGVQGQNEPR